MLTVGLFYNITLYIFIFPICLCQRRRSLFSYMDRPGTCIILDKKYNIANSSCHFGSYGSIWTGPSPKKYYMDLRSFGLYNIFLMTDRSMYCHMTRSDVNYLLFNTPFFFNDKNIFHQIFFAIICIIYYKQSMFFHISYRHIEEYF